MAIVGYATVGALTTLPSADDLYDLGSASLAWRSIYAKTSLVLAATGGNYTLNWANPGSNRTLTIPDPGAAANVMLDQGAYTIAGVHTHTANLVLSGVNLNWGTGNPLLSTEGTTTTVHQATANSVITELMLRPTSGTQVAAIAAIARYNIRDSNDANNWNSFAFGIDQGAVTDTEGDAWMTLSNNNTSAVIRDIIIEARNTFMIRMKASDSTVTRTLGMLTLDARNTVSGVSAVLIDPSNTNNTAPTLASAASVQYNTLKMKAWTLTLTGTTHVTTEMSGLSGYFGQVTLTDSSAVTVDTASTVYIAGAPTAAGSVTLTTPLSLNVAAGTAQFGGVVQISVNNTKLQFLDTVSAYSGWIFLDASNQLRVGTSSVDRWLWQTAGHYIPITANSYDIGQASFRVRTLYVGTSIDLTASNIVSDATTGTKIGTAGGATGQKLGFFNATPIVQPLLATGAGHTVDDVITTLQSLGLCRQS